MHNNVFNNLKPMFGLLLSLSFLLFLLDLYNGVNGGCGEEGLGLHSPIHICVESFECLLQLRLFFC